MVPNLREVSLRDAAAKIITDRLFGNPRVLKPIVPMSHLQKCLFSINGVLVDSVTVKTLVETFNQREGPGRKLLCDCDIFAKARLRL